MFTDSVILSLFLINSIIFYCFFASHDIYLHNIGLNIVYSIGYLKNSIYKNIMHSTFSTTYTSGQYNHKQTENTQSKNILVREGDWVCYFCGNYNYAFRLQCTSFFKKAIDVR